MIELGGWGGGGGLGLVYNRGYSDDTSASFVI